MSVVSRAMFAGIIAACVTHGCTIPEALENEPGRELQVPERAATGTEREYPAPRWSGDPTEDEAQAAIDATEVAAERDGDELVSRPRPASTGDPTIASACTGDSLGSFDYCSTDCLCEVNEGDCDDDDECATGLVCMRDTGALFGFDPEVDVCMEQCDPDAFGTPDFCSTDCPCDHGQGDCDEDYDCAAGNVCAKNVGASFGFAPDVDVCVDACDPVLNGTYDYCSPDCPCEHGQGDCDSDDDCAPGHVCTHNVGADFGFPDNMDVCVAVEAPATISKIVAGGSHTCALQEGGLVRCWGANNNGQLGYGHTDHIGDNETPASAGDVDVGGRVRDLVGGGHHTCALLDSGAVRCWGDNGLAQLGYGHTDDIGDNETPASAGDVDVGGTVVQLVAGGSHTCALLDTGAARCWGRNSDGQLGYGHTDHIGDNETPASAGDVNVGGTVAELAAGFHRTCARLDTGAVRCWGANNNGQLGYGHTDHIGDNETPASAGDVPLF